MCNAYFDEVRIIKGMAYGYHSITDMSFTPPTTEYESALTKWDVQAVYPNAITSVVASSYL
jgi:hypothetical protein